MRAPGAVWARAVRGELATGPLRRRVVAPVRGDREIGDGYRDRNGDGRERAAGRTQEGAGSQETERRDQLQVVVTEEAQAAADGDDAGDHPEPEVDVVAPAPGRGDAQADDRDVREHEPHRLYQPAVQHVAEHAVRVEVALVAREHPVHEVVPPERERGDQDRDGEAGTQPREAPGPGAGVIPPLTPDDPRQRQQRHGGGLLRQRREGERGAGQQWFAPRGQEVCPDHGRQHEHLEVGGLHVGGEVRGRRPEEQQPGDQPGPAVTEPATRQRGEE